VSYTLHPAPLHLTPCTLHSCTLHPASYTLHPAPCTLHPCILHPTPCTLHPAPHNFHPTPSAHTLNTVELIPTLGALFPPRRARPGPGPHRRCAPQPLLLSSVLFSSLKFSDTQSLCASSMSPPRNCCTFLWGSCSQIKNLPAAERTGNNPKGLKCFV